jgi:hypothetical protein
MKVTYRWDKETTVIVTAAGQSYLIYCHELTINQPDGLYQVQGEKEDPKSVQLKVCPKEIRRSHS